MSNKINVFLVNILGYVPESYARWIPGYKIVNKIKEADVMVLAGGEDVNPSLYGHKQELHTVSNPHRDEIELNAINNAIHHNVPILGICRGLQILNVYSGGKMLQHVEGHSGSGGHFMHLEEPFVDQFDKIHTTIYVNSLHHQMIYPFNMSLDHYKIIGSCKKQPSREYLMLGNDASNRFSSFSEPEIVYYPQINALGMQYHPEIMASTLTGYALGVDYSIQLLNSFINNHGKDKPFWNL